MSTSLSTIADTETHVPVAERVLARWAGRTPDEIACMGIDGAALNWAEVARALDRTAEQLERAGAGPGTRVALMEGRTRYALSSLLAIWACGASAVLLDERHPTERRRYAVRNAGCTLLVSSDPTAADLGLDVIDPAGTHTGSAAEPRAWHRPQPDAEAYVVYTSGTTGRPKGVMVSFANLENFMAGSETLGYRPGSRAVALVSPGFDGWLWSVLTPFVNGVGCVILDAETGDWERRIASLDVTNLCMTPTLYNSIKQLPSVEVAVVAGERCPEDLIARLQATADRVINVYGPTETTIAATMADTARGDGLSTIGQPFPGCTVEVVDSRLQPVPPGSEGEILIGGEGVALGYVGADEHLDDRFVIRDGRRYYRSGDLGVMDRDGRLRCLGRLDNQVKVAGFRVEFEEIESLARQVDGVVEAVGYLRGTPPAVALAVVLADGRTLDENLRRQLHVLFAEHLPRQLCPTFTHQIAAVPIDGTGKVARRQVAELADSQADAEVDGAALDGVLAAWLDVFGQVVAEDADFFALGGHSLLGAQLASALGRRFDVPVSVTDVLQRPTPREQAGHIDELRSA